MLDLKMLQTDRISLIFGEMSLSYEVPLFKELHEKKDVGVPF